jgi:hypothetical protein
MNTRFLAANAMTALLALSLAPHAMAQQVASSNQMP